MADNPFEEKSEHNPFQDPSVQETGGARGDGFDSPFDPPAAAPASPAAMPSPSKPGAYDRAPAPSSTFGAYDTGAYGGDGGSAYSAPAASAYDVRGRRTLDPATLFPRRLPPNPHANPPRRDGTLDCPPKSRRVPPPSSPRLRKSSRRNPGVVPRFMHGR